MSFPRAPAIPRDGLAQTILANGEYGIGITSDGLLCCWRHGTLGTAERDLQNDNRSLLVAKQALAPYDGFKRAVLRFSGRDEGNTLELCFDGRVVASSSASTASTHRDTTTPLLVGAYPKTLNLANIRIGKSLNF